MPILSNTGLSAWPRKSAAGADFIQTQCVYDMKRFKEWMNLAGEKGLTEKVHILAGVTPLKSARMAKYMATKVSGIAIPEAIIKRMEGAPKEQAGGRGYQDLSGDDSELEGDQRGSWHPYHGHRMGRESPGNCQSRGLYPRR